MPPHARIVRLEEALAAADTYHCIIAHNLIDLLDVKSLAGLRLYVIHGMLEGVALEQCSVTHPDELRRAVAQYLRLTGAHTMAVSPLKVHSWGLGDDVVLWTADPPDDLPYRGDLARGLRVANHIHRRTRTLLWDFHERLLAHMPITIIGHNGDMPEVAPAGDCVDLKENLSRHRFFVHAADTRGQLQHGNAGGHGHRNSRTWQSPLHLAG